MSVVCIGVATITMHSLVQLDSNYKGHVLAIASVSTFTTFTVNYK